MLNCCSLFFFFRYLYKGILYIFLGIYSTYMYMRSGLFRSRFLFLIFIFIFTFIFLLDCAFASSYKECTVPSVDM